MTTPEYGPIDHSPRSLHPPYDEYVPHLNGRVARLVAVNDALRGLELGDYDAGIVAWIGDVCDMPTTAVLVSWLHRVRAAGRAEAGGAA